VNGEKYSSESLCYNRFVSQDAKRLYWRVRVRSVAPRGFRPTDRLRPMLIASIVAAPRLGLMPFAGFKADSIRFTGETHGFRSKAANAREAMRNRCAKCISLVFGGEIGKFNSYTLYAGSLDDPSAFHPDLRHLRRGPLGPGRSSRRTSRFSTECRVGNRDPIIAPSFSRPSFPQTYTPRSKPGWLIRDAQVETSGTVASASTANSAARRWPAAVGWT
jgi:hypothetical protein